MTEAVEERKKGEQYISKTIITMDTFSHFTMMPKAEKLTKNRLNMQGRKNNIKEPFEQKLIYGVLMDAN